MFKTLQTQAVWGFSSLLGLTQRTERTKETQKRIRGFGIPLRQSLNSPSPLFRTFVLWSFVFVSCFGFRIHPFLDLPAIAIYHGIEDMCSAWRWQAGPNKSHD